jgi:pimeloyl-ACP methyl ester carboxylesterase
MKGKAMASTRNVEGGKSTNDHDLFKRLVQQGFRIVSRLSPGLVERLALRWFMTPPRRMGRSAPRLEGFPDKRMSLSVPPYRLQVWEWGDGPAVLLVHGWGGQASQWTAFAQALAAAGHRVVALDMPAHGYSSGRRTTLPDFWRAVTAAGAHAGPLHAVIAHSLGAAATALALADGLAAGRVVLIAPPADPRYYLRRLAGGMGLSGARLESLERRVERRAGVPLAALNLPRLAPLLETPALILHSRGDREVPFSHGEDIARAWPRSQLIALEGSSHSRVLRDPGVIAAALGFLGTVRQRQTPVHASPPAPLPDVPDDGDRIAYQAAR